MSVFYLALILSLIIGGLIEYWVVKFAYRNRLFDKPNARKLHKEAIPRLGGLAFAPTLLIVTLLLTLWDSPSGPISFHVEDNMHLLLPLLITSAIIFALGIIDDLVGLRYRTKFIGQALAGVVMCAMGIYLTDLHGMFFLNQLPAWLGWIITIFAIIYVTNAINFVDGIDGLASSLCAITLIYDAVAFVKVKMIIMAVLAIILLASLLPFMLMNMFGSSHGRTKTFMGDTGAMFLGLTLTYFGVLLNSETVAYDYNFNQFVFAFAPLVLPCFDVIRVVAHRVRNHKSPFLADKNHIHHKFIALGLSPHATLAVVFSTAVFLMLAVLWGSIYIDPTLLLILSFIVWMICNYTLTHLIRKKPKYEKS